MRKQLRIILVSLLSLYLFASILVVLNKDYMIPIQSSTENKELLPSNPTESAQVEMLITPNQTYLTIRGSVQVHFNVETGGEIFNGKKFGIFAVASWLQSLSSELIEFSSDIAEQFRENYAEILLFLLAFTGLSAFLFCRQKY